MIDTVLIDRFTAAFLVGVLEGLMMKNGPNTTFEKTRDELLAAIEAADAVVPAAQHRIESGGMPP